MKKFFAIIYFFLLLNNAEAEKKLKLEHIGYQCVNGNEI